MWIVPRPQFHVSFLSSIPFFLRSNSTQSVHLFVNRFPPGVSEIAASNREAFVANHGFQHHRLNADPGDRMHRRLARFTVVPLPTPADVSQLLVVSLAAGVALGVGGWSMSRPGDCTQLPADSGFRLGRSAIARPD